METAPVSITLQTSVDGLYLNLCSFRAFYRENTDEKYYYRHSHRAFEIHHVTHGRFTLVSGGVGHQLYAGCFALIAPGRFHASKERSPDLCDRTLTFELVPDRAAPRGDGLMIMRALSGFDIITGEGEDVTRPFQTIMQELAQRRPGYQSFARAGLQQLVLALARRIDVQGHALAAPPVSDLNFQRVFIIDNFFSDHFNLPDGDATLAARLGISRRQLDRVLKSLYGVSYRQKLLETRLEIARELLCETQYGIAEVAERLGYSSPANFSAFVKKNTGLTPTEIRAGAKSI